MKTVKQKYDELIEEITDLAQSSDDIRAVFIQGSRARKEMPADDWSDLDISIITTSPDTYMSNDEWLLQLKEYWLTFIEKNSIGGGMEKRVLFTDGLDVDFEILPYEAVEQMMVNGIPDDARYSLSRGMLILIDKDGIFDNLSETDLKIKAPEPPTEQEYINFVNDFIYHYVWTLKKLKRNEIWTAKGCSDNYMKWRLLSLAEWHSRAVNGNAYDTWHAGRFLESWADPRVVEGLRKAYARYDREDIRISLKETYKIFRFMALEIADKLGFKFPLENEDKVLKWADDNLG